MVDAASYRIMLQSVRDLSKEQLYKLMRKVQDEVLRRNVLNYQPAETEEVDS